MLALVRQHQERDGRFLYGGEVSPPHLDPGTREYLKKIGGSARRLLGLSNAIKFAGAPGSMGGGFSALSRLHPGFGLIHGLVSALEDGFNVVTRLENRHADCRGAAVPGRHAAFVQCAGKRLLELF